MTQRYFNFQNTALVACSLPFEQGYSTYTPFRIAYFPATYAGAQTLPAQTMKRTTGAAVAGIPTAFTDVLTRANAAFAAMPANTKRSTCATKSGFAQVGVNTVFFCVFSRRYQTAYTLHLIFGGTKRAGSQLGATWVPATSGGGLLYNTPQGYVPAEAYLFYTVIDPFGNEVAHFEPTMTYLDYNNFSTLYSPEVFVSQASIFMMANLPLAYEGSSLDYLQVTDINPDNSYWAFWAMPIAYGTYELFTGNRISDEWFLYDPSTQVLSFSGHYEGTGGAIPGLVMSATGSRPGMPLCVSDGIFGLQYLNIGYNEGGYTGSKAGQTVFKRPQVENTFIVDAFRIFEILGWRPFNDVITESDQLVPLPNAPVYGALDAMAYPNTAMGDSPYRVDYFFTDLQTVDFSAGYQTIGIFSQLEYATLARNFTYGFECASATFGFVGETSTQTFSGSDLAPWPYQPMGVFWYDFSGAFIAWGSANGEFQQSFASSIVAFNFKSDKIHTLFAWGLPLSTDASASVWGPRSLVVQPPTGASDGFIMDLTNLAYDPQYGFGVPIGAQPAAIIGDLVPPNPTFLFELKASSISVRKTSNLTIAGKMVYSGPTGHGLINLGKM